MSYGGVGFLLGDRDYCLPCYRSVIVVQGKDDGFRFGLPWILNLMICNLLPYDVSFLDVLVYELSFVVVLVYEFCSRKGVGS